MARDRASRPEARPLRLFVAVDIPREVRELVREGVAPLRERYQRARWVPLENQHVTLKFLGTTWPRLVGWVSDRVGQVAAGYEPFEAWVTGLGAFPSTRRARVLWVGLEDLPGRLGRIAAELEEVLAKEFTPEGRAFRPHLTLARFDPPVGLEGLQDIATRSAPFRVEELVLYRSHLQRPAPVYERLAAFALGETGGV
jgi:2'-5' RNA ligase